MIINFSVENFRSIKDKITLSFEANKSKDLEEYYIIKPTDKLRLLKLGIIYGANASGKTNILKALDFLRNIVIEPFDMKTETFDYEPFLFDKNTSDNTFFSLEFIQNKVKYLYEVELNKKAIIKEKLFFFKPNKALVFERHTNYNKQLSQIKFGNKIKIKKERITALEANTLWNNTVLGAYLKTNFESKELQDVNSWFDIKLKPLIFPTTNLFVYISNKIKDGEIGKNNLIDFLKKADLEITDLILKTKDIEIDDDFIKYISENPPSDISKEELNNIKDNRKFSLPELLFQHTIENKGNFNLQYKDESSGTQRYYEFSGLLDLMMRNEMIFPIDELEASLHPDLFKHFLLSFLVNVKNSQLIATTHHRELLMDRDILRNDAIWFTELKENGSTDLFSLDDFDTSVIRNTSSIYNAYKIGKLGAVPNLGDYYIGLDNVEK